MEKKYVQSFLEQPRRLLQSLLRGDLTVPQAGGRRKVESQDPSKSQNCFLGIMAKNQKGGTVTEQEMLKQISLVVKTVNLQSHHAVFREDHKYVTILKCKLDHKTDFEPDVVIDRRMGHIISDKGRCVFIEKLLCKVGFVF